MYLYLTLQQAWHKANSVPHFSFFSSVWSHLVGAMGSILNWAQPSPVVTWGRHGRGGQSLVLSWEWWSSLPSWNNRGTLTLWVSVLFHADAEVACTNASVLPLCVLWIKKIFIFEKERKRKKSLPWIVGCCSYGPCFWVDYNLLLWSFGKDTVIGYAEFFHLFFICVCCYE